MPWPPKQEAAIFMDMKRKKGEAAARNYMRQHASNNSANMAQGYQPRKTQAQYRRSQ